jgi:hypothetical protein
MNIDSIRSANGGAAPAIPLQKPDRLSGPDTRKSLILRAGFAKKPDKLSGFPYCDSSSTSTA